MEDFDPEDFDLNKIKFDLKSLKEDGISWFTRFLLRVWPVMGVKKLARELGFDSRKMEKADKLFAGKKVDIVPLDGGQRGFQIIIDRATALYFYQDGDHFVYDGSEVGEYEKGDVTVFDKVKK